ncbi:MAG: FG-GAP-like repeat-containing protein [Anaerolineae bacterium]|nr:FG-GAP-like repeat-containing protein [Anaerolineae bacterium]
MSYPIRRIALLCSLSAGVLLTLLVVILAASGSVTAASEATATAKKVIATDIFTNVTGSAGISAPHNKDELGTGQVFFDFDNDGWLDLFLTNQLGPNQLYRNNGDGTFTLSPLSAQVAITDSLSLGASAADFDNDGYRDLFVAVWGGPNALFHNDNGTGFTNVAADAGVANIGPSEANAWGDYDDDGFLDLYVANYSCDTCGTSLPDQLYHNNGDGTFSDVSHLLSLEQRSKMGFLAGFADYDNDGDADLYVINDRLLANTLWRNDGAGCGGWCFTDVSVAAGADTRVYGMGLGTGDYDNDLDLDFYFTNIGPMVLLQNQTSQGSAEFIDVAPAAGVAYDTVGWGAIFFDYDNDSWLDLYFAAMASDNMNRLFHNEQDGTFSDVTASSGASDPLDSIGVAYGDYDQDGLLDLIVGNFDTDYRLYRNTGSTNAVTNNWLRVKLIGAAPINRDAIGARVYLTTSDDLVLMQEVKSGSSFGAGSDLALHFGLGQATIAELTVRWPNGEEETYSDVPLNQQWSLTYSPAELALAPNYDLTAEPNTVVTRTHWLTNSGITTDTITLTVASAQGWTAIEPAEVTLASGASAEIIATFTVPNVIETMETASITARSTLDSAVSATVTDTVTVGSPDVGVVLIPDHAVTAEPNSLVVLTHTLTNTGTWTDTFAVTYESAQGWTTVAPLSVELASGASAEITALVTVPAVVAMTEVTTITVTSSQDGAVAAEVTDTVTVPPPTAAVALSPGQQITVTPGTTALFTHTITNTGTWTDTFTVEAVSSQGWTVTIPGMVTLTSGASDSLVVQLSVPDDATGIDIVTIMATSQTDPTVTASAIDSAEVVIPQTDVVIFLPVVTR